MSLTLTNIGYTYAPDTGFADVALDGVSLTVAPGELVLVLGATGSGKSTLLRVAAGLLEPGRGSGEIDGTALDKASARGRVGLVFQDAEAQLFADTLVEDVEFGPLNLGVDADSARAVARESLNAVGLDPDVFGERSPFSLSGGEARRAAVAGVLAMRPRYLLADEPTAGLDAAGRRLLKGLLSSARAETGVVVVSHTAEEFLGEADRVLVLENGRSYWYGPATVLVADPGVLKGAGLEPPDVLEVQRRARLLGIDAGTFSLDPVIAGERLARAGGWI